ncbi:MAG: uroporphyrinogen decarboxylase [Alphaproteobacteria bacterium]
MIKKLLQVLDGQSAAVPPVWLMRQAGRYLPEYRATRKQAGGFLDLCFNPELAAEVTLQPIRRFDFDAAIIFADILLLPHALGRNLTFTEGEGPRLNPLRGMKEIESNDAGNRLDQVFESLRRVRKILAPDKALIGFCGAPWTVACYMIDGQGGGGFPETKVFSTEKREEFLYLLDFLADASADYLCRQIEAGADAVQIFDSWAGLATEESFHDFIIAPTRKITALVRKKIPGAKIIGFPRGAGKNYRNYVKQTGIDAVGLDQDVALEQAVELQRDIVVQGNLAPEILTEGGGAMRRAVADILERLGGKPFIFNLGHGISKETPPDHVAELVRLVRGGSQ